MKFFRNWMRDIRAPTHLSSFVPGHILFIWISTTPLNLPQTNRFFEDTRLTNLQPHGKPKEKCTSSVSIAVSLGRKVGICSEYIDQLSKLHTLFESGAITKEQYDDLQGTVLSDLQKL